MCIKKIFKNVTWNIKKKRGKDRILGIIIHSRINFISVEKRIKIVKKYNADFKENIR